MEELIIHYLLIKQQLSLLGIGELYIQKQPAYVDPSSHTIHPPLNSVQFKPNPTQSEIDEDLITLLSTQNQISSFEAFDLYNQFCQLLIHNLNTTGISALGRIGQFEMKEDKSIQFISSMHMPLLSNVALMGTKKNGRRLNLNNTLQAQQPARANHRWATTASILLFLGLCTILVYYVLEY